MNSPFKVKNFFLSLEIRRIKVKRNLLILDYDKITKLHLEKVAKTVNIPIHKKSKGGSIHF